MSELVVKPKIRGFICTTAHPNGCAQHVKDQIDYVKSKDPIKGPKRVLIIGASTGYGLASWINAIFACQASSLGVFFEKEPTEVKTGTAGWYNVAALEQFAQQAGYSIASINGDAFSDAIKEQAIEKIKQSFDKVDLVVYSLASPRRIMPKTGEAVWSSLKTIGKPFTNKTVDPITGKMSMVTVEPGTAEEINNTVTVMGGEDWRLWIEALMNADVLADNVTTIAYSYIGPELTFPLYHEGTIGKAKEHLDRTAAELTHYLAPLKGRALISVNKAVVTQASSAIPVVPLYISILFKTMKAKGLHEDCIEQIYRLLHDKLYNSACTYDDKGRVRIDDWEMREDIQAEVQKIWQTINDKDIESLADLAGYRHDFHQLFGFGLAGIDYEKAVEVNVQIPSLHKLN